MPTDARSVMFIRASARRTLNFGLRVFNAHDDAIETMCVPRVWLVALAVLAAHLRGAAAASCAGPVTAPTTTPCDLVDSLVVNSLGFVVAVQLAGGAGADTSGSESNFGGSGALFTVELFVPPGTTNFSVAIGSKQAVNSAGGGGATAIYTENVLVAVAAGGGAAASRNDVGYSGGNAGLPGLNGEDGAVSGGYGATPVSAGAARCCNGAGTCYTNATAGGNGGMGGSATTLVGAGWGKGGAGTSIGGGGGAGICGGGGGTSARGGGGGASWVKASAFSATVSGTALSSTTGFAKLLSVFYCPSGYYCSYKSTPVLCSPGLYCPAGSQSGTICPAGSSCPPGSSSPQPCSPGT